MHNLRSDHSRSNRDDDFDRAALRSRIPHYLTHTTGSYSPGGQDKNLLELNFLTEKNFSNEEIV